MGDIISASRRTDIPAFYAEWFMRRVSEGCVRWLNPFSGKPHQTSLLPHDVAAIVFWSKNYTPLLKHLPVLESLGWGLCFHFTITGLPKVFEPGVPSLEEAVRTAHILAERFGPEVVFWRYDPVLISSATDAEYHVSRFQWLAAKLQNATTRCFISFPKYYAKVLRNVRDLKNRSGIECIDPSVCEKVELAGRLADIALQHGIGLYSCCGDYLVDERIQKAHCIDGPLLQRLFPAQVGVLKPKPTRTDCGCYASIDIGSYNTCAHGCVYCYANTSGSIGSGKSRMHSADADILVSETG